MRDKNWLWLFITYAIANGNFTSLGSVLDYMLKPFGWGSTEVSISLGLIIISGTIGVIVTSRLMDKKLLYKKSYVFCQYGFCVGFIIAGSLLFTGKWYISLPFFMGVGFFAVPINVNIFYFK